MNKTDVLNLRRFVSAQENHYEIALSEIKEDIIGFENARRMSPRD